MCCVVCSKSTENTWLHFPYTCSSHFISGLAAQLVFVTFSSESAHLSYHNKIPERDGLGINTVLSMNHPLGVTLHSAQSPVAACVLAALHTECQTWWHGKHFLYSL